MTAAATQIGTRDMAGDNHTQESWWQWRKVNAFRFRNFSVQASVFKKDLIIKIQVLFSPTVVNSYRISSLLPL